jgi:transposase
MYTLGYMKKQSKSFGLKRKDLGSLPIVQHFMDKIGLSKLLEDSMKNPRYSAAISLLIKNVIEDRTPLYAVEEWSKRFDSVLIDGGPFGDDVFARALDGLFKSDRASLLTSIVLSSVRAFGISCDQIHEDTTTIKVDGAYVGQNPKAVQLKRGHSKDHRPDLKQLVYDLSVTSDGAIPVHFKAHDGNKSDDTLHWDNWMTLRSLFNRSDFLYVADSKLCVSDTLMKIDRNQGRFVTVLPRTRAEVDDFNQRVLASMVRWEKVMAKRSTRKSRKIDLFEVAVELYQMREGFKIYWFRSSEKMRRDFDEREEKIDSAMTRLRALADPQRKKKPKREAALRKAANDILLRSGVKEWLKVDIALERIEKFKQANRGRSSSDTLYRKSIEWLPRITCQRNESAIAESSAMDGIFPLVTNTNLDAEAVLKAYKYQPKLEKRHALLKSGLSAAPIFIKRNDRIESLMFVYFIAQLICALIERELKQAMTKCGLKKIQILPEERPSANPTSIQVTRVFQNHARHVLSSKNVLVQTFSDPLTPIQKQILDLLGLSPKLYA